MGYMLDVANAIRQVLINTAMLDLNERTCSIDLDQAINYLNLDGKNTACLIMFSGGTREAREPFQMTGGGGMTNRGKIWKWRFNCILMLKYTGGSMDIEVRELEAVDALMGLLDADRRLGGLSANADIVYIGQADGSEINDMAFYFLPFSIEVWNKT